MDLKKSISLFFLIFFIYSCEKNISTYSFNGYALGTNFNVLYNSEKPLKNFKKQTDSLFSKFNKSLSTYIQSSDISRINNGENSIIVDDYFIKVFKKSKSIWKDSDGYFDPTIGLLTNAYGLGPNKIPNYSINIDSLLNYTGFEKVNLVNNQIQMKNGMFLDFNAIAKGYAVDLISEILIENGVNNFLIDIGGEMYANEINNVKNTNWRVGITDPLNPDKKNNRIFLENKAIASSGNYRKFLIDPRTGDKIVHTINPKNGNANQTNILSTSVIADDCMTADGYSTAFMAMPLELSKMVVQSKPEIEAMIIYVDKKNEVKTFYSPGFEKLLF
jgi:thiamine biosynthesis lipoprotein